MYVEEEEEEGNYVIFLSSSISPHPRARASFSSFSPTPARPCGLHQRESSSREVAPGYAVVTRGRRWRPQANGRKINNKCYLDIRPEFT